MKKIKYLLLLLITTLSCQKEHKTFSVKALNDQFITQVGEQVTFQNIVDQHKGKKVFIDIWASWCGDCLKSIPQVKALQNQFKNVDFVFLSLDKSAKQWQYAIKKYNLKGDHYYMPKGKKCDFANFVNISWIPRYMVLDSVGNIELFKAITTDDNKLIEALKK